MVRKLGLVATVAMTLLLAASPSVASSTPRTLTTAAQAQDVGAVYFLNPRVGWASVDSSARLLMTTDGGGHWLDVSPPMLRRKGFALASGLAGADFLSSSDFFVSVFNSGPDELQPVFLLHTTDAGRKWNEVGYFPNGVGEARVSFLNNRQGWVVVGNGEAMQQEPVTIYETTTGGGRWSVISRSNPLVGGPGIPGGTPGGPSVGGYKTGLTVSRSEPSAVLWLTGQSAGAPFLARSIGGRHWTNLVLPTPLPPEGGGASSPVFSSASSGALSAWYGGPNATTVTAVYSTANGGTTWVEHQLPSGKPVLADVVSSTTWFAASGRTLYRTINGGVSWSRIAASVTFGSYDGGTLDFVNTVDGWTILGAQVWHTTDGGHIWVYEVSPA
jgi:photosystem II stability/assembly factor-like uncharacterized protein